MANGKNHYLSNFAMADVPDDKTPEQLLWCHVLDRAILDYGNFFDWFLSIVQKSGTRDIDYPGLMNRELRHLEWFFFSKDSQPHNLNWIIDVCYDGNEHLPELIRSRVIKRYQENLSLYYDHAYLKPYLDMFLRGKPLPERIERPKVKRQRNRSRFLH